MAKKLRHALIGSGNCGVNKHLAAYAKYPEDVQLYGVFDIDPAAAKDAAERYKVPHIFDSYEALLADPKIDVVSIATPNAFHAPITIAAVKAGKHVHVEKPISMNAIEAQAIVDAKNATGKKVMVALNNRFTNTSQFAKKYVDEGHLGDIYTARCGWRRRQGYPMHGRWFSNKELSGGGPLIDLGVHFIDLTLFLMGYPAPVAVVGSCYDRIAHSLENGELATTCMMGGKDRNGDYTVEDLATGFVRLETGASVTFEFSWGSHTERQDETYMDLLGTKGGLSMRDGVLKIFSEASGQIVDILPKVENTSGWGDNETRHFIDCIKNNTEPISKPEEGVKMMKIIDAIYASSESGREVCMADAVGAR